MQDHNSSLYSSSQPSQVEGVDFCNFRRVSNLLDGRAKVDPSSLRLASGDGNFSLCSRVVQSSDPSSGGNGGYDGLVAVGGKSDKFVFDYEFVSGPAQHAECVREVMAFVRGERVGLERLRCVLPTLCQEFASVDMSAVLVECGLTPLYFDGKLSFYFCPNKEGQDMFVPKRRGDMVVLSERLIVFDPLDVESRSHSTSYPSEDRACASDQLMLAFVDISSSWHSSFR